VVILGPGSLYTSILATLVVRAWRGGCGGTRGANFRLQPDDRAWRNGRLRRRRAPRGARRSRIAPRGPRLCRGEHEPAADEGESALRCQTAARPSGSTSRRLRAATSRCERFSSSPGPSFGHANRRAGASPSAGWRQAIPTRPTLAAPYDGNNAGARRDGSDLRRRLRDAVRLAWPRAGGRGHGRPGSGVRALTVLVVAFYVNNLYDLRAV